MMTDRGAAARRAAMILGLLVGLGAGVPSAAAQDVDADGLSDADELMTHMTDPALVDTDGDGLSDGDEVLRLGTNPLSRDSDSGGVEDWIELLLGTDPTVGADDAPRATPVGNGWAHLWARSATPVGTIAQARAALSAPSPGTRSFVWTGAINFSNQPLPGPHGPFADHTLVQQIWGANQSPYAGLVSGWVFVPPATAMNPTNEYTFAVSSDEGFALSVFDGVAWRSVELDVPRTIATGPLLVVDFPDTGGLFPVELLHWDGDATAGVKLSWAEGAQAMFLTPTFALISGEQVASPALVASQRVVDRNGGAIEPGDTLEFIVQIENLGLARTRQVRFRPTTLVGAIFDQYTALPAGAQVSMTSQEELVLPFVDRGATVELRYSAQVLPSAAGVLAQGELRAQLFDGSPSGSPGLRVFTTDPLINGGMVDTANKPEGLFPGQGRSDDEPNQYALGQDVTRPSLSLDSPPDQSSTFNSSPLIFGLTEPGAEVLVSIDGGAPTAVTADVTGAWHYLSSSLMPGMHMVTVEAQDAAGNRSLTTLTHTFTVEPGAFPLTLDFPYPNQQINTAQLNYTGSSGNNAAITLTSRNAQGMVEDVGNVSTGGGTSYSYVTPFTLTNGPQIVEVRAVRGGVTAILVVPFIVDVFPSGLTYTYPTPLSTIGQAQPTLRGTCDPFALVEVEVNLMPDGATRADANGMWQFTPSMPLMDGFHVVRARPTDVAGNVGLFFNLSFTTDTTAPPLTLVSPAPNTVTRQRQPTITGSSEPGATVRVSIDGQPPVTVIADLTGRWSVTPQQPLAEGPHQVTVIAADPVGNQSAPITHDFTIDSTAPTVSITSPMDAQVTGPRPMITGTTEPGAFLNLRIDAAPPVTVPVDAQGAWAYLPTMDLASGPHRASATATDAAGNAAIASVDFIVDATPPQIQITSPEDGAIVRESTPTLSGTTEPRTEVIILLNDVEVARVTSDDNGDWSWTVPEQTPLMSGPLSVRATATDALGNSASDVISVTVELPEGVSITSPQTQTRQRPTFTVEGQAPPGAVVELFVDDVKIGEAMADAQGRWTFMITQPLADGERALSARVGQTRSNLVVVRVISPGTLTITSPSDGEQLADDTPIITGAGPVGDPVTVIINGQVAGMTTVGPDGTWIFQVGDDQRLARGANTIEATSDDGTGQLITSGVITVTYDPTSWTVTITSPAPGESISATPTITGSAPPNAEVTVVIDGQDVGTTRADANGQWTLTLTPQQRLTAGEHTISARASLDGSTRSSAPITVSVSADQARGYVVTGGPACASSPASPGRPAPWLMLLATLLAVGSRRRRLFGRLA